MTVIAACVSGNLRKKWQWNSCVTYFGRWKSLSCSVQFQMEGDQACRPHDSSFQAPLFASGANSYMHPIPISMNKDCFCVFMNYFNRLQAHTGSCGSGGRVGCSLISGSPPLPLWSDMGKTLNPKLALMGRPALCMAALPLCEWVIERQIVKCFIC